MNKTNLLNEYSNTEDRLLISKVLDKLQYCDTRNKITYLYFLNLFEKNLIINFLKKIKKTNYLFYGGYDNCERTVLFFYPSKYDNNIILSNIKNIIKILRIELPKDLYSKYNHKIYLGGLMKLGIKRETIGDIITYETGADIIILENISNYLYNNIQELTRFQKCNFQILDIENLKSITPTFKEFDIILPSLRLDSFVSHVMHCSRNKAIEIINDGRVFVNFSTITKYNKILSENDIITIRGTGRFYITEILGKTKKDNVKIKVKKPI